MTDQSSLAPAEHGSTPRWQVNLVWVGLGMWAAGLAGLAWLFVTDFAQAKACTLAAATFYYAGQFGAMPMGLAAGGDPVLVVVYVWLADVAGLFVFFALTQFGVDRLATSRSVFARPVRSLQRTAHRHQGAVNRYGPWGLFVFTIIPFLFNSPILGAIMGRIAGIPARKTIVSLTAAITIMSVFWGLAFHEGLQRAGGVDDRLPWVLALGSVALTFVVAGIALTWRYAMQRFRRAAEPSA